jgi:predicted transposase YdaD
MDRETILIKDFKNKTPEEQKRHFRSIELRAKYKERSFVTKIFSYGYQNNDFCIT